MSIFLPTSRTLPDVDLTKNAQLFTRALNKFTQDTAEAVNKRTIGIYTSTPVQTGNIYFNATSSSLRKVFSMQGLELGLNTIPSGILITNTLFICSLTGIAQFNNTISGLAFSLPYVNMTTMSDSIGLYFSFSDGNIVIETSTNNWNDYSVNIILEYLYT